MKVLFLINYAGSGGSERYVELLARAVGTELGMDPVDHGCRGGSV